jgi:hypothetical protein
MLATHHHTLGRSEGLHQGNLAKADPAEYRTEACTTQLHRISPTHRDVTPTLARHTADMTSVSGESTVEGQSGLLSTGSRTRSPDQQVT